MTPFLDNDLSAVAKVLLGRSVTITCCTDDILVGHTFEETCYDSLPEWNFAIEVLTRMQPDVEHNENWSMNIFCTDGLLVFPRNKV